MSGKLKGYQWIVGIVITLFLGLVSVFYFSSYKGTDRYTITFDALQQEVSEDSMVYVFPGISLPKGKYLLKIDYLSNASCQFDALIDNSETFAVELAPTDDAIGTAQFDFELEEPTDKGRLTFTSPLDSPISLADITIINTEGKHIYSDGLIWGVLSLIMIPLCWIGVYFFGKSSHKMALLITIILTVAMILPIVWVRVGVMGIDSKCHMMRVEGIYQGILDHQFPVVVYPQWNNGYGQIGVLYPDTFLYIPAAFRLLNMSQYGTMKLFLCMLCVISATISFASARSMFKNDWQIIIATAICIMGDMHLHDLYYAGKFGGSYLADMFWPLLIAGLYHLYYDKKEKWYYISIGLAAIFCSHITSATVAVIMIVVLSICNIDKLKLKATWQAIGKAVALFLVLIIGNSVSFVKFYFSDWGQDTLQWADYLENCWGLANKSTFDHRWLSVMGILLACAVLIIICRIRKDKLSVRDRHMVMFVLTAVFLFWLSTVYFPWKQLYAIPGVKYYTNMLQCGFRFLPAAGTLLSFALTGLLEVCLKHRDGRKWYQSYRVAITVVVVFMAIIYNMCYEMLVFVDDDMLTLYYDEVMGEVEVQMEDYLPKGTKTEWYQSDAGYISDENAVKTVEYSRSGNHILYVYSNTSEDAYVEFPKFYYDGYLAVNAVGEELRLEKGNHNRVRVYLENGGEDELKELHLEYHVPLAFILADVISLSAWGMMFLLLAYKVGMRLPTIGNRTSLLRRQL